MLDMRYEEEGTLIPHSRAHQEHLQFVNDLLKEEDDTWQNVGSFGSLQHNHSSKAPLQCTYSTKCFMVQDISPVFCIRWVRWVSFAQVLLQIFRLPL